MLLTRAAIAVLAVLLAAASIAAVVAVQQRQLALEQRDIATSRQLAAQADLQAATDLRAAMSLSLAAVAVRDTHEARASLARRLQQSRSVDRFLTGGGSAVRSAVFRPNGTTLLTGAAGDRLSLWDTAAGSTGSVPIGEAGWSQPSLSPDGRLLAAVEGEILAPRCIEWVWLVWPRRGGLTGVRSFR